MLLIRIAEVMSKVISVSMHRLMTSNATRVMHSSQFGFNLGLISRSNFDKACPNLSS